MSDRNRVTERLGFHMNRRRHFLDDFEVRGFYRGLHYRKGILIAEYPVPNLVTNAGKDSIFNVYFRDATQIAASSWVMGLISSVSYTAIAAGDTMGSHAGWTEFTAYDQSNRVAWGPGASSGQTITNATPATFDFNATGTVKGIFITSQNTKGGTTGTLWSVGLFASDVPVVDDDQIKLTYAASL